MNRKKRKIVAVIVTYNPDFTLLEQEYYSMVNQVDMVVYVDNNSVNQSFLIEWCKKKGNVRIIINKKNKGLAYAQNQGIKIAMEVNASHVILFDQDSVIDDNFIQGLYETERTCINQGIKVGVVGPVYRSYAGVDYPILSIIDDKLVQIRSSDFNDYIIVTHNIASGQLIRMSVFQDVGMMRDDYFIEYVDYEWCFRLKEFDYVTVVTKKASMKHKMGDNQIRIFGHIIGLYSPFRRYFTCRNTILFYKENYIPRVLANRQLKLMLGKVFVALVFGPHRLQQLRYCFIGLYDGIKGVTGECSLTVHQ